MSQGASTEQQQAPSLQPQPQPQPPPPPLQQIQLQPNPNPPPPDVAAQQLFLQQFAARLPNNNANQQAASGAPSSSAAGFLPASTIPRKTSASSSSPSTSASGAAGNTSAAGAAATSTPDVASLQAQLQARMIQAQQQAMQAAAMRTSNGSDPLSSTVDASGSSSTSSAGGKPNGVPDWAAAAAMGNVNTMLGNIAGTDRDAIMKQLHALQTSHAQRSKHTLGGQQQQLSHPSQTSSNTAPSPASASIAAPSPATVTAPSPASATTPSHSVDLAARPSSSGSAAGPGPSSGSVRPPISSVAPVLAGTPGPGSGSVPGTTVRPPAGRQPTFNKQHILASLAAMFRQANQPLPTEIFNGERDGAFKLGDAWIELMDMFMNIFRIGGMMKLMQAGNPEQHPIWPALLSGKNVPNPLLTPLPLPRRAGQEQAAQPQLTTNPIQYLVAAYFAWVFAFEQAMQRSKLVAMQKQQALAAAATAAAASTGSKPPSTPITVPDSSTPTSATDLTTAKVPTSSAPTSSAPTASAPTPSAPIPSASTPSAPTPAASTPVASSPLATLPYVPPPGQLPVTIPDTTAPAHHKTPLESIAGPTDPKFKHRPRLDIQTSSPSPVVSESSSLTTVNGAISASERKRRRNFKDPSPAMTPVSASGSAPEHTVMPASNFPPIPPKPKRARYRVEYRPLHMIQPTLGGWDERTIASSFPKHNVGRPTRSHHELHVDVEAILMGLKSRLPGEIGYAFTVLSMLSMPLHDGTVNSLPILPLMDVYLEVLDLVSEAALGEDGLAVWLQERDAESLGSGTRGDLSRLSFAELEQLGHDFDMSADGANGEGSAANWHGRERTGGTTDIILAGLNIIRNFSFLADNQQVMARPELLNLLAAITDVALVRMPGEPINSESSRPYSILEFARIRRESVAILANLGSIFDLRTVPSRTTLAVFRLVSSFLSSAWECFRLREPGYGPSVSIREVPPTAVLSIDRALEAFGRLALLDHNREVFSAVVPGDDLVSLFAGLVKLFPLSQRDVEAMHSVEDYLGRVELLALAVYSLAFLAPLSARADMRSTPGATTVLTRVVYDLAPRAPELKTSPFGILVRRVAETLGVLNGTVNPGGNADRMSFSAGGVEGKGWRFASDIVQPGWLAYDSERVLEAMGWGRGDGRVWRIEGPAFSELDGLWCG